MNLTSIFAVLALLSLVTIPALGEMTDYQKGVMDGLQAGLIMGKLLGAAPYDPAQAQEYNNQVNLFNQGLTTVFGNNQTALSMFWMQPQASTTATPLGSYSTKPVHKIDESWNQTRRVNTDLISQGRYYGYDLDTYIAMTGHVPSNIPASNTLNTQNGQDPYGGFGAGP
ncbi:Uncharacterised protein [uncultured archaeon]|nr:Uncharacterised protein [uncultured archaeon]